MNSMIRLKWVYFGIVLFLLIQNIIIAQEKSKNITSYSISDTTVSIPDCTYEHDLGKLFVRGGGPAGLGGGNTKGLLNCISNKFTTKCGIAYPNGSNVSYLQGVNIHLGGIIGRDTLVSSPWINEFYYTSDPIYRSTLNEDPFAVSENDIIIIGDDVFYGKDYIYQRPDYYRNNHTPLEIQVSIKSYSWTYEYAEDFVVADIEIKNIGNEYIEKAYIGFGLLTKVGLYVDRPFSEDDIGGYKNNIDISNNCVGEIPFHLIWVADNDGDPIDGVYKRNIVYTNEGLSKSAPDIVGLILLNNQQDFMDISYNWFTEGYPVLEKGFGPMLKKNFREYPTGPWGEPIGDRDFYSLLSNKEIDYEQTFISKILPYDSLWVTPPQEHVNDISDGFSDVIHLLSFGPFDLAPSAGIQAPIAIVAGEDFHTDPNNIDNLPNNPQAYYRNLDFSDIAKNAMWARWIYDNPGVDTDGDGDSGRAVECNGERIWVEGDGIPDWKAAGPPPAPYFWLTQEENAIHVRFNGSRSETDKDIFTKIADFEGYNIYFGRDDRETSLSLVGSYDLVNYDKYVWHPELGDNGKYIVEDIPYSLDSLKCLYANSCDDSLFEPTSYTATIPLYANDSIFYFTKHHFNSELSAVSKVYPNARDPRLIPEDSLTDDDFTEEGYYKFFEYEFTIDNLLPTVEYWVNVTAFDFGSPKSGLQALESSKTVGIQEAYPLSHEEVVDTKGEVYVYPNPYRIDAGYRANSFEGIGEEDRHVDRVRKINFANLPPKCEIKIFSLDGDLVRHLSHDVPESDPTHTHHTWDLITRNTQLVVSGLYYWTVEFPNGETQIGKIMIIM